MKKPIQIVAFFAACVVVGFILREWFGFATSDLLWVALIALYAKHATDIEKLRLEIEALRQTSGVTRSPAPDPSHLGILQPSLGRPSR